MGERAVGGAVLMAIPRGLPIDARSLGRRRRGTIQRKQVSRLKAIIKGLEKKHVEAR